VIVPQIFRLWNIRFFTANALAAAWTGPVHTPIQTPIHERNTRLGREMDHHAALGCDMVLLLGLQGYDTSTELNYVRIAHERRILVPAPRVSERTRYCVDVPADDGRRDVLYCMLGLEAVDKAY
jgi:hypothetical protein